MALHTAALGMWMGVIVLAAIAAAITFPTLAGLGPTLGRYAAFEGDHAVLAGGHVMNPIFIITAWAALGLWIIAALAMGMSRPPVRLRATVIRQVLLGLALGTVVWQLAVLNPRMQGSLGEYRRAAEAGNTTAAQTARDTFDDLHPQASFLIAAQLFTVAGALMLAIVASGPTGREEAIA